MKKALLFVLALAVIPVGVDAQGTELAQLRALAEQGNAVAQNDLGVRYGNGRGVLATDMAAHSVADDKEAQLVIDGEIVLVVGALHSYIRDATGGDAHSDSVSGPEGPPV